MTTTTRISGWGFNVPEKVLTNQYFADYLDTSDQWIESRTGIKERRWAEPETGASDVALPACLDALKAAGTKPEDIDIVVCATCTPDMVFPSTACLLQGKLGCSSAYAFDVNAVCSGFIYAFDTAHRLITSGAGKKALVIGVDLYSKIIDPQDRTTCVLFGDGAGAVVLEASDEGVIWSKLGSDGSLADILKVPEYLKMEGKEVFKHAVRKLSEINAEACKHLDGDCDYFLSHQANKRILYSVADQLDCPHEKMLVNVEKYGNTSAASVPILLAENLDNGTLEPGHNVVFSAFGGGVTWGAIAYKF